MKYPLTWTPEGVHVYPDGADPEHQMDGLCWCQPLVEDVPPNGRLYTHRRSLDSPHREPDDQPLNCCGSREGHLPTCETVRVDLLDEDMSEIAVVDDSRREMWDADSRRNRKFKSR